LRVIQIFLEDPKPGEFGSLYCKDQIKYLRFEEAKKSAKWIFGKNEFNSCIISVDEVPSFVNGDTFNFTVHEKYGTSINDGSLGWDDLNVPAISFHEYLTHKFCSNLDFNSLSRLKAKSGYIYTDTNSGLEASGKPRKVAILGKNLKLEDLSNEFRDFTVISNISEFRRLVSSLCFSIYGSAQFSELCKFIRNYLHYEGSLRGGAQAEIAINDYFTKIIDNKSKVKVSDLVKEISIDDTMSWYCQNESSPLLIDPRTFFKFVACNGTDITTKEPIYLSKYKKEEIGEHIGVYLGLSSQKDSRPGSLKLVGALESSSFLSRFNFVQVSNFTLSNGNSLFKSGFSLDIKDISNIFEKLKKKEIYPNSTSATIRGITIDSFEAFEEDLRSSGPDIYSYVYFSPWPKKGKLYKYASHATTNIAIPSNCAVFELRASHPFSRDITEKSGSEQLNFIDSVIMQAVHKENGNSKWNASNKSNLTIKEKREEIAKKLEDIYFAIQRPLRFILKATLGFPKINRSAIVLSSSLVTISDHDYNLANKNTEPENTIINSKFFDGNNFLVGAISSHKSPRGKITLDASYIYSIIELAMSYGSFKALEEDARNIYYDKNVNSMAELFDHLCSKNGLSVRKLNKISNIFKSIPRYGDCLSSSDESETENRIGMIIDKELCLIDLSILSYNIISGAFFVPLLTHCIENESILNIDGIKNPLVSPKDYFIQYLEGFASNVLVLSKSIYA
jgi:hypothetical protein